MSRFSRFLRWALLGAVILSVIAATTLGAMIYAVSARLPDVQTLRRIELQQPMFIYARDGRLMGLFGEMRRYPVKIGEVPERVKQAFLAAEDANFYEHKGVDFKGVTRALWLLAKTRGQERVAGGSTITQQVAKQFFLSSEYSFRRKFAEMLLAMKMERELGKDEIFELYLNKSFFGNRSYGIAAAAEFYYGKSLEELSLDEIATLAGTPKFPSSGNPLDNPERNRERRDHYVLPRMVELKYISATEAQAAMATPMHAAPHERQIEVHAPYVAEMVRQEMIARFGDAALTRGYQVTTTIDPTLQEAAGKAVLDGLRLYDRRHGWRKPEQTVELPADADARAAAKLIRNTPAQAGMLPAVVLGSDAGGLRVALANGSEVVLGPSAGGWTGRNPATLAKRGDLVRVVRKADANGEAVGWTIDQLPAAQAALVSLDADNGALRALVGGFSYAGGEFNRATQAKRQPGSSFKPFLYAAAFERGFNPASIVLDAPVVFKDRRGKMWRPQNDGGSFSGPMRVREALVRSKNLVSVRLLDTIGVDYARRYISHFGFDEASLPPNLSMSLGTASLPVLSVARGYTAFANGGFLTTPWFIESVRDHQGNEVFREKPSVACPFCQVQASGGQAVTTASTKVDGFDLGPASTSSPAATASDKSGKPASSPGQDAKPVDPEMVVAPRAIDPRVAWQLNSMMRDVVKRGTATAARVLNREDVGGKTGSTNDHRDAWFSGFGGPYVTTVWVGKDDFRSLGRGEYGGKAALPIWIDYMKVALKDQPERNPDPPEGMVKVSVGANGQLLPGEGGGIVEWVKVEDLERMQSYVDFDADAGAEPAEETFDIF